MAVINQVCVALPRHRYSSADICAAGREWLQAAPDKLALFQRFVSASNTQCRSFAVPVAEVLGLRGLAQRASIFEEEGSALGVQVVRELLESSATRAEEIVSQVFTSCSCPVIPSVDAIIAEQVGLRRDLRRVPVFQFGCAGGVAGLALASRLVGSGEKVLLTAVELCSLVFQFNDHSSAQLVGGAIFADGAASVLLSGKGPGLEILAAQSYLLPGTRHLMGYDIHDDGFHLRLDRELPSMLSGAVTPLVDMFLQSQGLKREQIAEWLFHPGGMKILDALDRVLEIDPARSCHARTVLQEYGNLSSASVLLVLREYLRTQQPQNTAPIVMLGIGPGLTLELILMRQVG